MDKLLGNVAFYGASIPLLLLTVAAGCRVLLYGLAFTPIVAFLPSVWFYCLYDSLGYIGLDASFFVNYGPLLTILLLAIVAALGLRLSAS